MKSLPIQTVSTGMAFTIVPFRSLAALQKLKVAGTNCSVSGDSGTSPASFTSCAAKLWIRKRRCTLA